jgi:hypothetical protein
MKENTRRLIPEESKDTQVMKHRQPLPDLPTIDGEISAPKEGLWTDADNKPGFYLGMVHLQVLKIDDAWTLCSECFGRFERGPGKQFERVIQFVRSNFSPDPKVICPRR